MDNVIAVLGGIAFCRSLNCVRPPFFSVKGSIERFDGLALPKYWTWLYRGMGNGLLKGKREGEGEGRVSSAKMDPQCFIRERILARFYQSSLFFPFPSRCAASQLKFYHTELFSPTARNRRWSCSSEDVRKGSTRKDG